jgi:hypothetical protein
VSSEVAKQAKHALTLDFSRRDAEDDEGEDEDEGPNVLRLRVQNLGMGFRGELRV